jgi:epoxyqueuosine reductase
LPLAIRRAVEAPSRTPEGRLEAILEALRDVVPDAVFGSFRLSDHHLARMEPDAAELLAPYVDWSIFVFAVPITDDGLWVWHHHGRHRSLMANYVLAKATRAIQRRLEADGELAVDLPALTHDEVGVEADLTLQPRERRVSMTELGELAGLGTRGWNNVLLHPEYGSWLQIHAMLVEEPLPFDAPLDYDVCTQCMQCIDACPVDALSPGAFDPDPCRAVVAAPWESRSAAEALTSESYIECRECITSCPIGLRAERIFEWRR